MFNLQGSELVIILLLALVVLGPEKLPDAMRKMGQFYAELKKMSSGFQQEFRSVVDEPLREVRDTANMLRDSADFTKLQDGERDEKPKSAEMVAMPDPAATPVDEVPTFEGGSADPAALGDAGDDDADDAAQPVRDPFANSAGFSAGAAIRESDPDVGDAPADDAVTVTGASPTPIPTPAPFSSSSRLSFALPDDPPDAADHDDAVEPAGPSDTPAEARQPVAGESSDREPTE